VVRWDRVLIHRHTRNGTDVSGRRTPPARGSRDQNQPTIGADHITAGPPYTAVDCRRSSFSGRRCPHLERPAAPRHVRIISACFSKPSEDAHIPAFFPVTFVQCLRSDSCPVIINTLIVHFTYLPGTVQTIRDEAYYN